MVKHRNNILISVILIDVIMKLSNEFQEIEKTIFDTENARAKVIIFLWNLC